MAQAERLPLVRARTRRAARGPAWAWTVGAAVFALGAALTGLLIGPVHLGVWTIVRDALSHVPYLGLHSHISQADSAILWQLRAPRVVLGLLVGALLASAGATYQGVFRNPLA